ncbi:hypothetical protein OPV22_006342 [Ensete ventricosum]|uniref:Chlorophyll a-b binding protein, chloroplastic n=1 Tax=Ensete ventricosum TaxID=4639 RepID=A0AAV8RRJ4_ENSVE|nr:hypothetical protein OPV22_006342 [Ensete ventricosum]
MLGAAGAVPPETTLPWFKTGVSPPTGTDALQQPLRPLRAGDGAHGVSRSTGDSRTRRKSRVPWESSLDQATLPTPEGPLFNHLGFRGWAISEPPSHSANPAHDDISTSLKLLHH